MDPGRSVGGGGGGLARKAGYINPPATRPIDGHYGGGSPDLGSDAFGGAYYTKIGGGLRSSTNTLSGSRIGYTNLIYY